MQVGIPLNNKDHPCNVPPNKISNNELKTAYGPNASRSQSFDKDSDATVTPFTTRSTIQSVPQRPNQFNKSSSLGNLSFINIVGLPYHPRQTSVPSTASTATLRNQVGSDGTVFPNHFRNASEPYSVPPRPPRSTGPNVNNNNTDGSQFKRVSIPKGHVVPEQSGGTTTSTTPNNQTNSSTQISSNNRYVSGEGGTKSNETKGQDVPEPSNWNHQRNANQTNENISNINVNFYRAVPMNVISSVPTIKCLNNHSAKNVSNVQIMPLSGTNFDQNSGGTSGACNTSITSSQVTVRNEQTPTQLIGPSTSETVSSVYLSSRAVPQRTFTSTEAQTDDTVLCCPELSSDKERRRRERRERRHNRRANPVNPRPTGEISTQTNNNGTNSTNLPDILDTHLPPPYTTRPNTLQRNQPPPNMHQVSPVRALPHLGMIPPPVAVPPPQILSGVVPSSAIGPNMLPHPRSRAVLQNIVPNSVPHVPFPAPNVIPGQVPLVQNVPDGNSGFRFALPVGQFRRDHFSEEAPKGCCGVLSWKPGSLKWLIASIALVAVGCVLVGTALGTMRPAGRDHITVALLMIGIGIVLVTISGIAWRLASQNATSCRTMLGIGSLESVDVCARRFVPRLPPSYGRPHHPYAAMMYPEFQYRPPPPTYQASMQEYRLRLLLIDRGNTPQIQAGAQNAVSPPPTYRSHTGSLIRDPLTARNEMAWSEYSCPPSYRSQTYSTRLGTIQDAITTVHTRDPSLSTSEHTTDNAVVDVVSILRNSEEDVTLDTITLDSKTTDPLDSKTTDQDQSAYKLILEDCGGSFEGNKEENLVTIVQTDERNPVIVTVSGSSSTENTTSNNKLPSEIQILAHL